MILQVQQLGDMALLGLREGRSCGRLTPPRNVTQGGSSSGQHPGPHSPQNNLNSSQVSAHEIFKKVAAARLNSKFAFMGTLPSLLLF